MLKYIIPVILFLFIGHGCSDPSLKKKTTFQPPDIQRPATYSH